MQLQENTKNELKKVVLESLVKDINESYIYNFIDIVNHDSLFAGKIQIAKNNQIKLIQAEVTDFILVYDFASMKHYFSKRYEKEKNKYALYDKNMYFYYLLSLCLIHEIAHLYQILCSQENVSKYLEVNELYRQIFYAFKNIKKLDKLKYELFCARYCFERNANIIATNFLEEVFRETNLCTYARLYQITSFFKYGYSLKNGKIVSPVDRTFKYLHIKENISSMDLPFAVAFEHGFSISEEDYHSVYDAFLDTVRDGKTLNYDETMRRIRNFNYK